MGNRKTRSTQNGDVVYFEYTKFSLVDENGGASDLGADPGHQIIYIWDIDKTYLDTKYDTFRGLIKTAFEKAFQKVNVPGTATLIRALSNSLGEGAHALPVYFISASPPQMENKIHQKMLIDRLNPYGIFFKDNLKNIRPRKFKRLKQQVGFKIQSLLELSCQLKGNFKLVLFGDDSESDAVVYCLFSDICKRRLSQTELLSILGALHVLPEQRKRILDLQKMVPESDPVDKVYINLVADTDPDYYAKFGRRVLATFTTFQAALDLYQDSRIDDQALVMVAKDMIANYSFTPEELAKSFDDLIKRRFLKDEFQGKILPILKEAGVLPSHFTPAFRPTRVLEKIGEKILGLDQEGPWVVENIDYLNDFR